MVTYIFYYIRILYILFTLMFQKYKKNLSEGKKDIAENVHKTVTPNMQIMTRKTTTLRTYVHVVLHGVICPQILYDIVLYARHFLLVKFFPKCYLNKVCFELPQNVT